MNEIEYKVYDAILSANYAKSIDILHSNLDLLEISGYLNYAYAYHYNYGKGVKKDKQKSKEFFLKADILGNKNCLPHLALIYLKEHNFGKAKAFALKSNRKENGLADYVLSQLCTIGSKEREKLLDQACELENTNAMREIALQSIFLRNKRGIGYGLRLLFKAMQIHYKASE